ncbi:MAG: hypothetical protein QXF85_00680 [Candidatus Micrarchaeaceae archaeon]
MSAITKAVTITTTKYSIAVVDMTGCADCMTVLEGTVVDAEVTLIEVVGVVVVAVVVFVTATPVLNGVPFAYLQPHSIKPLGHVPMFPHVVLVGHVTLLQLTQEVRLANASAGRANADNAANTYSMLLNLFIV